MTPPLAIEANDDRRPDLAHGRNGGNRIVAYGAAILLGLASTAGFAQRSDGAGGTADGTSLAGSAAIGNRDVAGGMGTTAQTPGHDVGAGTDVKRAIRKSRHDPPGTPVGSMSSSVRTKPPGNGN